MSHNLSAGGGWGKYDDDMRIQIESYEPNLNLKYIGIDDTLVLAEGKNKPVKNYPVTGNIAVYDIVTDKINYIFNDAVTRKIIGFNFESAYLEEYKTIEFNNSIYEYNGFPYKGHSNFRNIPKRPLSNNLIIISQDSGHNTSIWLCDKYGNNLKKELEFDEAWQWEIDVKNQLIRISRQLNSKIEIRHAKY